VEGKATAPITTALGSTLAGDLPTNSAFDYEQNVHSLIIIFNDRLFNDQRLPAAQCRVST